MMAPEKLRPEDIDSAIAQTTHGARPDRDADRDEPVLGRERAPQQTDWLEERDEEADIPDIPDDELRIEEEEALAVSQPAPRRMLPVVAGGVGLLVVAALVWWMFRPGPSGPEQIPVVAAEPGDVKTKPADEGGMQMQNQDLTVYGQIAGRSEPQEPQAVLPQPEAPITRPPQTAVVTPEPDAPAAAASATEQPAPAGGQSEVDAVLAEMRASAGQVAAQEVAPTESTEPSEAQTSAGSTQTAALPEATATPAPGATSPPAAPAAAGPRPATDPVGAVRIQLAAFRSESQAQVASERLQHAFQDELAGRTFHVERADLGAKGVFYRLQAGPLASRDEAAALCSRLKQRGQPCIVVAP